MHFMRLSFFMALGPTLGQGLCLDNAVPESERAFIQDGGGNNIKIGIFEGNWPSAGLLSELIKLLMEEVLGFHSEIHEKLGASGASPIWALAGCRDFDAAQYDQKQCGESETVMHVSLDSWIGSYSSLYAQMRKDHPTTAPLDLGSMGYSGEESVYVQTYILDEAYRSDGLALDFYKSFLAEDLPSPATSAVLGTAGYDVTHHNAKKHFSSIHAIPLNEMARCNETDFSTNARMYDFVRFSNDYDGMVRQDDGTYVAKCPDGHWWPAPACRSNHSECIPLFTAGNGWKLQAIMQWTVAYGMPVAVGISSTWGNYVKHSREQRALHYWWVPDSTFIELKPEPIVFPRHSALEWSKGDKKTSAVGSYVAKMVSSNLASKARSVQDFISQMTFELSEIMDLLLQVTQEGRYNVSCNWARNNVERWTAWVPVRTNCYAGFGLANDEGVHVTQRADATQCVVCPEGTFSEEILDETGKTYRCSACPSGTYQDKIFSSSCKPCARGSYSDTPGGKLCKHCDVGFYQALEKQTTCSACPADRTTRLLAATGEQECVCKATLIEKDGQCIPCDEESLWCPVGSTIEKLNSANGTDDANGPYVKEHYFTYASDPLEAYKCRNSLCPGGAPESCSGGREGLTCERCPLGQFASTGPCSECGDWLAVLWVLGLVLLAVLVVGSYYVFSPRYVAKASPIFRAQCSGDIAVMVLQNVGVVQVAWTSSQSLEVLGFTSLFVLDLKGAGISCLFPSPAGQYAGVVLVWPVVLCTILLANLCSRIPCGRYNLSWDNVRTVGMAGKFMQIGFTSMTNIGLMPFVCFMHPNGAFSMLTHGDILCGSAEHTLMQICGGCILVLAFLFLSACMVFTLLAPHWSSSDGTRKTLGLVNFLIRRFQPNAWWFGCFLLARGPLLSLPTIIAPDSAIMQLSMMLMVLVFSLCVQATVQPWQTPWLNMADTISVAVLLCLLAVSMGCNEIQCDDSVKHLSVALGIFLLVLLSFFFLLAWIGAIYSKVTGRDLEFLNLAKPIEPEGLAEGFQNIAQKVRAQEHDQLGKAMSDLCYYDLHSVKLAIQALHEAWNVNPSEKCRQTLSGRRICSSASIEDLDDLDKDKPLGEDAPRPPADDTDDPTFSGELEGNQVELMVPELEEQKEGMPPAAVVSHAL
ncbi:unnamed protein product [Durusdinium trenchii]|uniref:Tyrosine-protein kinase ephrin type A/B receptor-like domain-containing protein n=1 Tax=Durusdinium trenchii TaxID=1381693 RepID=A0ABP0QLR2_9DINO